MKSVDISLGNLNSLISVICIATMAIGFAFAVWNLLPLLR